MNPAQFRVHIEAYLNLRSSLGFQTEYESYNLRELSDYVEAKGFSWPIRTQTILDWIGAASLHCGLPGQRMRLTHARCFLKHLRASVPDTEVPGPSLLPHEPRPKPRWYSPEEIAKLQQATSTLWKPGSLSQRTSYSLIGLLASTGLRAGEVIALTVDDVRLGSDPPQLYIRKAKFYKSRIVPIHSSTADQLRAYLQERNRVKLRRPSKAFFITGRRQPLSYSALRRMFRQLVSVYRDQECRRQAKPFTAFVPARFRCPAAPGVVRRQPGCARPDTPSVGVSRPPQQRRDLLVFDGHAGVINRRRGSFSAFLRARR
jgi:integrase/recombinase XerD